MEINDFHAGFSRDILAYHPIGDMWTTRGKLPRQLGADPGNRPNDGVWGARRHRRRVVEGAIGRFDR